ncbi:protein GPR108 isoform X1 [Neomonachus schauinslandi]|uniref:Protein GPR108 isoform X1 n=1 Tax=Neomonachus schauinslandi TaxID=29088 RepID=A0A8M1MKD0_NEOSC|nr:protein GPR108 isoform X1 [Neomonachus schauinslandi]
MPEGRPPSCCDWLTLRRVGASEAVSGEVAAPEMAVSERRGLARRSPAEWGLRLLLLLLLGGCSGRIHRLALTGEKRADIPLNSFGFYANGSLEVDLSLLRLGLQDTEEKAPLVGFSLTRARSGSIRSYSTQDPHDCPLRKNSSNLLVLFLINTKDLRVQVRKYGEQKKLFISPGLLPEVPSKPGPPKPELTVTPKVNSGTTTALDKAKSKPTVFQGDHGKDKELVLGLGHLNNSYNFSFHVVIGSRAEEGQYNLNFHNCYNSKPGQEQPFDITVMIREKNPEGFLSAAEIPLFKLYMVMSACFLAAGIFWVSVLCKNMYNVFKIHWLMAVLAFTKSISLLFHSINYYFINSQGHPIEGLAVMHYITHLLKGALLFITIALIGSGWAFVKYILSDKEKKIFGIVIPLQVLANVAYIVIESREEGASDYVLWKEILFLVDLICCGAILFPVVCGSEPGQAEAVSALLHHGHLLRLLYTDHRHPAAGGHALPVAMAVPALGGGLHPGLLCAHWLQVPAGRQQPLPAAAPGGQGGHADGANNDRFWVPGRPVQTQQNSQRAGAFVIIPCVWNRPPSPTSRLRPPHTLLTLQLLSQSTCGRGRRALGCMQHPALWDLRSRSPFRGGPPSPQALGSPVPAPEPPTSCSCAI